RTMRWWHIVLIVVLIMLSVAQARIQAFPTLPKVKN
uniref:Cytochrome b n=1 Tax=Haemonchus contortus TaxID=6289 RepID=A0A7I4YVA5_HAECO